MGITVFCEFAFYIKIWYFSTPAVLASLTGNIYHIRVFVIVTVFCSLTLYIIIRSFSTSAVLASFVHNVNHIL